MASLNESKYAALQALTGLSTGTLNELEYAWLKSETGASSGSLNELRMMWCEDNGFATGGVNERLYALMGDQGYTGNLAERLYQFWAAGGVLVP